MASQLRLLLSIVLGCAMLIIVPRPASAHIPVCVTSAYQPGTLDLGVPFVQGSGGAWCSPNADFLKIQVCLQARLASQDEFKNVSCEYDEDASGSEVSASVFAPCLEGRYRYRSEAISTKTHGATRTKRKVSQGLTAECRDGELIDPTNRFSTAEDEFGPDYTAVDAAIDAAIDQQNAAQPSTSPGDNIDDS